MIPEERRLTEVDTRRNYVKDQLGEQHITFKTADTLTAEEQQSGCLVAYAGQALSNGKQAECYANDFIGLHLKSVAGGQTYADLGAPQSALTAQVAAAQNANDPALAGLQQQLATISAQRDTLFKGETLRGLLLTSYGFSVFGVKGGQVATVAYLVAGAVGAAVPGRLRCTPSRPARTRPSPIPSRRHRAATTTTPGRRLRRRRSAER